MRAKRGGFGRKFCRHAGNVCGWVRRGRLDSRRESTCLGRGCRVLDFDGDSCHCSLLLTHVPNTAYLPSNVIGLAVGLVTVSQYVTWVPSARSTAMDQPISGTPMWTVVGTIYQTTCHEAGQLKVNQR